MRLMRFDRPVGTLLLLWPTLAALWIAGGRRPSLALIVIFTLGTIVMRAAGCVINDYARSTSGCTRRSNARSSDGAKQVSEWEALTLFAVLLAVALVLVFSSTISLSGSRSAVPRLRRLYPFMKRWTYLPQIVLGAAFSWGIVMAFAATGAGLGDPAWLMFICERAMDRFIRHAVRMVDRDDDVRVGIKSTAFCR